MEGGVEVKGGEDQDQYKDQENYCQLGRTKYYKDWIFKGLIKVEKLERTFL